MSNISVDSMKKYPLQCIVLWNSRIPAIRFSYMISFVPISGCLATKPLRAIISLFHGKPLNEKHLEDMGACKNGMSN
jgi:hypothetical protein